MSDQKKSNQLYDLKRLQDQLIKMGSLTLNNPEKSNNKSKNSKPKQKLSREELKKKLRNKTNILKLHRQSKQNKQRYIDKKTKDTGAKIN